MARNPPPNSVQNPATKILPGAAEFGIAQGSIFVVYGSNLGAIHRSVGAVAALDELAQRNVDSGNGWWDNCDSTDGLHSQHTGAAVLPSNTPTGTGTLTVK